MYIGLGRRIDLAQFFVGAWGREMIVPSVLMSSSDLEQLDVALSDKANVDSRVAFIETLWAEKFGAHYKQISLGYKPHIKDSYARAEYGGNYNWIITFRAKLVADPSIDEAVLRFIFAHEIAHVIGDQSVGDRCSVGIAAEGEADYFLATVMQRAGYASADIDGAVAEGLKWLKKVAGAGKVDYSTAYPPPCFHPKIDCRVNTIQMGIKFALNPQHRDKPDCAGPPN
jgi:hypothetical protein